MLHTRRRALSTVLFVLIVVVLIVLGVGTYFGIAMKRTTSNSSPLILYSADAYAREATTLEGQFEASSGIQMVPPKSGGSLTLGQEIAQGNPVSVFLSVSKSAVSKAVLGSTFPGWAVEFESDQMAITYSNSTLQSNPAGTVLNSFRNAFSANTTSAWFDFFSNITSGFVKVGISNPNADPAGYRAWIVLEAAGYLYDNNPNYFVNRMISNRGNITAASAADLVSPLQEGNIQFLFIYKSAGLAQELNLMNLPNQINLGSASYSSFYAKFNYTISTGTQTGGLIALFLSVPKDSTDPGDSLSFVVYAVKNAPSLLGQFGLQSISPAKLYNDSAVPQTIEQLISDGYLVEAGSL